MNIAQAMKQKNRLAKKLAQIRSDIQTENSRLEGNTPTMDIESLMKEQDQVVESLIRLKIAIFVASTPVREHILRMAEYKAIIGFLNGIDTRSGQIKDYGDPVSYEATFSKSWVREQVEKCEAEIDVLQDELDAFNHRTEVIVSQGESEGRLELL